jgi:hypothetical protein
VATWEEADEVMNADVDLDLDVSAPIRVISVEDPFGPEVPKVQSRRPSLTVVEHFDFTMVDMNASGANIRIRQLSRGEAISLIHLHNAEILALNNRGQISLEREIGTDESKVPCVGSGRSLLVMTYIRFSDIRWHLVEYMCDGEGVVD